MTDKRDTSEAPLIDFATDIDWESLAVSAYEAWSKAGDLTEAMNGIVQAKVGAATARAGERDSRPDYAPDGRDGQIETLRRENKVLWDAAWIPREEAFRVGWQAAFDAFASTSGDATPKDPDTAVAAWAAQKRSEE